MYILEITMMIISSQIKTEINASVKLSQKFKFFYFFIKKKFQVAIVMDQPVRIQFAARLRTFT